MDIRDLILARPANAGRTRVVGIDGHGGSGKSTLAQLLAHRLDAEVVHTDDFASWDNPKNWWPLLVQQVLEPVAVGAQTLSYPRSQWWPQHRLEPVRDQPVTEVMLLEGVGSLRWEFRRFVSFGIFVEAPRDVCMERGFARDAGQGTQQEIRERWESWYRDEEGYIGRTVRMLMPTSCSMELVPSSISSGGGRYEVVQ